VRSQDGDGAQQPLSQKQARRLKQLARQPDALAGLLQATTKKSASSGAKVSAEEPCCRQDPKGRHPKSSQTQAPSICGKSDAWATPGVPDSFSALLRLHLEWCALSGKVCGVPCQAGCCVDAEDAAVVARCPEPLERDCACYRRQHVSWASRRRRASRRGRSRRRRTGTRADSAWRRRRALLLSTMPRRYVSLVTM